MSNLLGLAIVAGGTALLIQRLTNMPIEYAVVAAVGVIVLYRVNEIRRTRARWAARRAALFKPLAKCGVSSLSCCIEADVKGLTAGCTCRF